MRPLKLYLKTEPDLLPPDDLDAYRVCTACGGVEQKLHGHQNCGAFALLLPKLVAWDRSRGLDPVEVEGSEEALRAWSWVARQADLAGQQAKAMIREVPAEAGGTQVEGDLEAQPDLSTLVNLYHTVLEAVGFVQDGDDLRSWRYEGEVPDAA